MHTDSSAREGNPLLPAAWRILLALLHREPLSQTDIRERTGLSHPIVVQQVARLRQVGLISCGKPLSGQPGRPPVPLMFNWDYRRLLAIEVRRSGMTAQVTNLAGMPLGAAQQFPLSAWNHDTIRHELIAVIRQLLGEKGMPWAGVGIVIPGVTSRDSDAIISWSDFPAWQNDPLGAELSAELDLPVIIEPAGRALACAFFGAHRTDVSHIVAISLRHLPQVQVGVIAEGVLLRGATGRAGEVSQLLTEHGQPGQTLDALFRTALEAPEQRASAVRALADVLATLMAAVSPDHVILQGDDAWSEADSRLVRDTLVAHGCSRTLPRLVECPNRADEALAGIAYRSRHATLDLQTGMLAGWAGVTISDGV